MNSIVLDQIENLREYWRWEREDYPILTIKNGKSICKRKCRSKQR